MDGLKTLLQQLLQPMNITYSSEGVERFLFPAIFEPFLYSIIVLFAALILAIVISILLSLIISLLPNSLYKAAKSGLFVFESLPDVLIAVLVQFIIISIYRKTNILLFNISAWGNEQPYVLPILCLTVLPTLLCLRVLLYHMEEEWEAPYIENARGKGLSKLYILIYHVLPNTLVHFFNQSKMILWFMLSNLLVIEILFNIYGITNFVYRHGKQSPVIFTIASLLVFLPMFIFFVLGSWWTNKWTVQSEAASATAIESPFSLAPYWQIVKRYLLKIVRPLRSAWDQPYFVFGFCIIFTLLALSLIHNYVFDNEIPKHQVIYAKDGFNAIGKAPFEPSSRFWFGTDQFGNNLLYQIISGAKYTLGLAFLISFIRLFASFAGGYLFYSMNDKLKSWVKGIVDATHYVPVALLCYFIMFPVVIADQLSFWDKGVFYILVLTIVAVPAISVMIGSEMELISKREFVTSAKVLGGSQFHVFRKHILPHLLPKLSFIYIQQIMYVLILFAHLGLLQMFFGGTIFEPYAMYEEPLPLSVSNEWSGLVGINYRQLLLRPYLIIIPVLFFAISIVAMNFMLEGLRRGIENQSYYHKKKLNIPSLVIVLATAALCIFSVQKFSSDFAAERALAVAAEKKEKAERRNPIVTLDEGTFQRFEEGTIYGVCECYLDEQVPPSLKVSPFGKLEKVDDAKDRTVYYFKKDGYEYIVTVGLNWRVQQIKAQIDGTREEFLKAMPKPTKQTKKLLSYNIDDYLVRLNEEKDGWWISIQDKDYFK